MLRFLLEMPMIRHSANNHIRIRKKALSYSTFSYKQIPQIFMRFFFLPHCKTDEKIRKDILKDREFAQFKCLFGIGFGDEKNEKNERKTHSNRETVFFLRFPLYYTKQHLPHKKRFYSFENMKITFGEQQQQFLIQYFPVGFSVSFFFLVFFLVDVKCDSNSNKFLFFHSFSAIGWRDEHL